MQNNVKMGELRVRSRLDQDSMVRLTYLDIVHFLERLYSFFPDQHRMYPKMSDLVVYGSSITSWKKISQEFFIEFGKSMNGTFGRLNIRSDVYNNPRMRRRISSIIACEWFLYGFYYSKDRTKLSQYLGMSWGKKRNLAMETLHALKEGDLLHKSNFPGMVPTKFLETNNEKNVASDVAFVRQHVHDLEVIEHRFDKIRNEFENKAVPYMKKEKDIQVLLMSSTREIKVEVGQIKRIISDIEETARKNSRWGQQLKADIILLKQLNETLNQLYSRMLAGEVKAEKKLRAPAKLHLTTEQLNQELKNELNEINVDINTIKNVVELWEKEKARLINMLYSAGYKA